MSQKKVEQYKKEKANRKKLIAKQKREALLLKFLGFVITFAFVAFIGVSVYFKWFKKDDKTTSVTYNLSDKEVSSVYEAYKADSETTVPDESDTTADSQDHTSAETTQAE